MDMEQPILIREGKEEKEEFMKWKNHITEIMDKLNPEKKYSNKLKQTIIDYLEFMGREEREY